MNLTFYIPKLNEECLIKSWSDFLYEFQKSIPHDETTLKMFDKLDLRFSQIYRDWKTNGSGYVAKEFLKWRKDVRTFLRNL